MAQLLAFLPFVLSVSGVAAQKSGEHLTHHPGGAAPPATPMAAPPEKPPPKSMGMMDMTKPAGLSDGETMGSKCCGGQGSKPFYPRLIAMPSLTLKARKAIRTEAIGRSDAGSKLVAAGQADLYHAKSAENPDSVQAAMSNLREGLSLVQSGTSALQALDSRQSPNQIALTWFNNEMVISAPGDEILDGGFRDLSWLHVAAMLMLAAALITALILRWRRLKRIGELASRLAPGGNSTPVQGGTGRATVGDEAVTAKPAVQKPWRGVLRIKAIFDETPTVKTFRLMEPSLASIPFTFLPGQYATITSEIDGHKVRRSYTISSSPTQREYIELTVKREDQGLESRHLHDHAKTGDLLEISAPAGQFFFTGKEAKGIVLIAGGVGITPMMSVLRDLTDRSYEHPVHLICAAATPSDLIFREEIAYLEGRHPTVTTASIVAKAKKGEWSGPVGFITADFIVKCAPDISERRIHLCGPPPMMDAVKGALAELNVPPDQIKTENFAPPKGGPVLADESTSPFASSAPIASGGSAIGIGPSAQSTVQFSRSNKSGKLGPDQSVLEAAEAVGVIIDFECRVGTCGRCMVPLTQGAVTMEIEDALSTEDKAQGLILACQAKSSGSLVVDA